MVCCCIDMADGTIPAATAGQFRGEVIPARGNEATGGTAGVVLEPELPRSRDTASGRRAVASTHGCPATPPRHSRDGSATAPRGELSYRPCAFALARLSTQARAP